MILKVVDQLGENQAHLPLVTAHQYGIVQCVLTDLAYLNEVFPQYCVLLHAGNDFAFRRTPDNEFIDVFHSGNMGNGEKGEKEKRRKGVRSPVCRFYRAPLSYTATTRLTVELDMPKASAMAVWLCPPW